MLRVHPSPEGLSVECAAVHCSRSMGVGCWHTGMQGPSCCMLRSRGEKRKGEGGAQWAAWGCTVTTDVLLSDER